MANTNAQPGSGFSVEEFKRLNAEYRDNHDAALRQQLRGVSVKHLIPFYEERAMALAELLTYVKRHLDRLIDLAEKGERYEKRFPSTRGSARSRKRTRRTTT